METCVQDFSLEQDLTHGGRLSARVDPNRRIGGDVEDPVDELWADNTSVVYCGRRRVVLTIANQLRRRIHDNRTDSPSDSVQRLLRSDNKLNDSLWQIFDSFSVNKAFVTKSIIRRKDSKKKKTNTWLPFRQLIRGSLTMSSLFPTKFYSSLLF